MNRVQVQQRIFHLLAEILEYPQAAACAGFRSFESETIIRDALTPALQKMLKQKDKIETEGDKLSAGKVEKPQVYQAVLESLLRMLQAFPANAHE